MTRKPKKRALSAEDRLEMARDALKRVKSWEFATDGRKFNGNHKEVLKMVMEIADDGLMVSK